MPHQRIHEADIKRGGVGYTDPQVKRPAVPHALRSTFRDWAAENAYERNMAEMQLAHAVGSSVERAYLRTDMIERRREMMEAWGNFLQEKIYYNLVLIHLGNTNLTYAT